MSQMITEEGLQRLDAALAWIKGNPEKHDQALWFRKAPECGTTCCLAGALSMLAGARPLFEGDDIAYEVMTLDGRRLGADEYASELIGLDVDSEVIGDLFVNAADLDDLIKIRDALPVVGSQESTGAKDGAA